MGEDAVEVIVRLIGFSSAIAGGTGQQSSIAAAAASVGRVASD